MRIIRNYALKTRLVDTCPMCGAKCNLVNTRTDTAGFECGLEIRLDQRTMAFVEVWPCNGEKVSENAVSE